VIDRHVEIAPAGPTRDGRERHVVPLLVELVADLIEEQDVAVEHRPGIPAAIFTHEDEEVGVGDTGDRQTVGWERGPCRVSTQVPRAEMI
jgi:hypothetical protein